MAKSNNGWVEMNIPISISEKSLKALARDQKKSVKTVKDQIRKQLHRLLANHTTAQLPEDGTFELVHWDDVTETHFIVL